MRALEVLVVVLAVSLWGAIYWPVFFLLRITCPEGKAFIIALFWPITIPAYLLWLSGAVLWKRK